ncbi:hypothetical protein IB244_21290 [Rhizobium sp. RHZ02]|uniref:hypothetical protein n=1 Tax=Rhizobium sp. RHZ02 TaxID=2769306 RepID=UPI0017853598|nr:hypothetical protein [Rhizobium sp. RHZ02]MBD9454049.1 hypothetical protein [Rhizobium sp. RHZ02]
MNEQTARRIIDAIAVAIDGKPSSAKTFSEEPFIGDPDLHWWKQYEPPKDTNRTEALTIAYLLFSGGRIPLRGVQMRGAYFRPDKWLVGAFLKKGHASIDETSNEIVFTQAGWEWVAGILQGLAKA